MDVSGLYSAPLVHLSTLMPIPYHLDYYILQAPSFVLLVCLALLFQTFTDSPSVPTSPCWDFDWNRVES